MPFYSFKAILFSYAFFYYFLITISLLSAIFWVGSIFHSEQAGLGFCIQDKTSCL